MKSAATIFLLALLVSIQTPVVQFIKLPLLIEHFFKHQKQEGVHLMAFLADHYATGHKDADWPEDEQLPFKGITCFAIGYALVPGVIKPMVQTPLHTVKKMIIPVIYSSQQYQNRIFHPPKA